jgi:hypothetical protein
MPEAHSEVVTKIHTCTLFAHRSTYQNLKCGVTATESVDVQQNFLAGEATPLRQAKAT